jgi:hypothetical protein
MLARTLRNEMPLVRHRDVATEPGDQRLLAKGLSATKMARADEGGVSFWFPGIFNSGGGATAASFSFADLYIHSSVSGGATWRLRRP